MSKPIDHPGIQQWFAAFRERLSQAFPLEPVPSPAELIEHDCDECRALRDAFAGQRWADVPAELVDTHCDDLSLFTLAAYRYYLPAFLLRAFSGELDEWGGSAIVDYAIYSLCPSDDECWRARFEVLTAEQLRVLAGWLAFVLSQAEVFDPDVTVGGPGLERYWRAHAG